MSPCLETDILQIQSIPCWGHSYLHCRGVSLLPHDCGFGDLLTYIFWAPAVTLVVKNLPVNARDIRDIGLIPGSGRSSGGGSGNPLQYSCLENPMDRGAWQAKVYRASKSQTRMKQLSTRMMFTFQDSPVAKDCGEPTSVRSHWIETVGSFLMAQGKNVYIINMAASLSNPENKGIAFTSSTSYNAQTKTFK